MSKKRVRDMSFISGGVGCDVSRFKLDESINLAEAERIYRFLKASDELRRDVNFGYCRCFYINLFVPHDYEFDYNGLRLVVENMKPNRIICYMELNVPFGDEPIESLRFDFDDVLGYLRERESLKAA